MVLSFIFITLFLCDKRVCFILLKTLTFWDDPKNIPEYGDFHVFIHL